MRFIILLINNGNMLSQLSNALNIQNRSPKPDDIVLVNNHDRPCKVK